MYSFIVHWHTDAQKNRRFVLLFCIANSSRLPPATNLCSKLNLIQIRCHCHLTFVRFISVFSTNLFIFGFHVSLIVHFIDNRFNCWKIDQIIEWYALLLLFLSATGWIIKHFHFYRYISTRHTCEAWSLLVIHVHIACNPPPRAMEPSLGFRKLHGFLLPLRTLF